MTVWDCIQAVIVDITACFDALTMNFTRLTSKLTTFEDAQQDLKQQLMEALEE
jgi:hypothetical protein